jgi:hypothetical protein
VTGQPFYSVAGRGSFHPSTRVNEPNHAARAPNASMAASRREGAGVPLGGRLESRIGAAFTRVGPDASAEVGPGRRSRLHSHALGEREPLGESSAP